MPHKFMRPFHFWCQKVLPLVFDDSLSYYEVLAKMRDYLNNAIAEINAIGGEFEGVKNQLTQLQTHVDEYFAELDVNQAISDKLDDMVESGEMDAVITPIFAAYANPLFAASVADMIATNFAYANYENNKIYTFNQNTGLYQTTGKEFGGVVSSVDEMEDNDKYYALDSNGMLYGYDFPQAAFVASELTYGGYRYGVNAMRPISNVYVLTTDSHVYTWNGNEYVDTGVVYGLNNTAFVWRKRLTNTDNVLELITDGWYSFKSNSVPQGLPSGLEIGDGFVITYTIPDEANESAEIRTENNATTQTQRTQNISVDSRDKRVTVKTVSGGSWFWDGVSWTNETELGYPICVNANLAPANTVLECNNQTINVPNTVSDTGLLKTFSTKSDVKSQLYFSDNDVWYRNDSSTSWVKIVNEHELNETNANVASNSYGLIALSDIYRDLSVNVHNDVENIASYVDDRLNVLTEIKESPLMSENAFLICDENANVLDAIAPVAKVDTTLTQDGVPADSFTVGDKIATLERADSDLQEQIYNETNRAQTAEMNLSERVDSLLEPFLELAGFTLLCENGDTVCAENNAVVEAVRPVPVTDKTLQDELKPANAKATGDKIAETSQRIFSTMRDADNALSMRIDENKQNIDNNNQQITRLLEATITFYDVAIVSESGDSVYTENGYSISGLIAEVKTDTTLNSDNLPANSASVGAKFNHVNGQIEQLQNTANELIPLVSSTAENKDDIERITAVGFELTFFQLVDNNNNELNCENSDSLGGEKLSSKTDKTLTQANVAADAKETGDKIDKLTENWKSYLHMKSSHGDFDVVSVELYGELPTTKTNVDLRCRISKGDSVLYDNHCLLKVQGSSSVINPEKNYTLTLNNAITLFGYTMSKWVLKCNYTDPSQCRNIVGARTFKRLLEKVLPPKENRTIATISADTITAENGDTIYTPTWTTKIQKSMHWGTTDGEIVYVAHDDEFHGVYTMQIPKNTDMFGMSLSSNQFFVGLENWDFTHIEDVATMKTKVSVEEQSDDMTDEVILEKLNALADFINDSTDADFRNNFDEHMNHNIAVAYLCLYLWTNDIDGGHRNMNLYSYDGGETIDISAYDMDAIFGLGSGGFEVFMAGRMGGSVNGYATADSGTNAINRQPLTIAKNANKLFKRLIEVCPDWLKTAWTNYRSNVLNPGVVLYDFMTMQAYSSERAWEMDYKNWGEKPKTMFNSASIPAIFAVINSEIVDAAISAL